MTAWIQALDVQGQARELHILPPVAFDGTGKVAMTDGYPAALAIVRGRNGAAVAYLTLTAQTMRQLADYLTRYAAFLDARSKGEPGRCICTAWVRSDEPCPNGARPDYAMCTDCWPDGDAAAGIPGGQAALNMSHRHLQTGDTE